MLLEPPTVLGRLLPFNHNTTRPNSPQSPHQHLLKHVCWSAGDVRSLGLIEKVALPSLEGSDGHQTLTED